MMDPYRCIGHSGPIAVAIVLAFSFALGGCTNVADDNQPPGAQHLPENLAAPEQADPNLSEEGTDARTERIVSGERDPRLLQDYSARPSLDTSTNPGERDRTDPTPDPWSDTARADYDRAIEDCRMRLTGQASEDCIAQVRIGFEAAARGAPRPPDLANVPANGSIDKNGSIDEGEGLGESQDSDGERER